MKSSKRIKIMFVLATLAVLLSAALIVVNKLKADKIFSSSILIAMMLVFLTSMLVIRKTNLNLLSEEKVGAKENDFVSDRAIIEEERQLGTWLLVFGIIAFLGLLVMIVLMIIKGFNFDYLYAYIIGIGVLLEFIIMPASKKQILIRDYTKRIVTIISISAIIIGIILLILKFLNIY